MAQPVSRCRRASSCRTACLAQPSAHAHACAERARTRIGAEVHDVRLNSLSGDKAAYAEWKELHDKADVVLYLMRADLLIAGDPGTETRVRDDLKHIGDWLESRNPRPRFFFIGTHCDLDPEFSGLTHDRVGDYVDRFRRLPIVAEMVARAGGAQAAKVVIGSMKTIPDTEALVYQLFRQVIE